MRLVIITCFCLCLSLFAQTSEKSKETEDTKPDNLVYMSEREPHPVVELPALPTDGKPRNIILMIGDGMGVSHIHAGATANGGNINMYQMPITGLVKTSSADYYVTDSAAAGTALATGVKTNNGRLGLDPEGKELENVREYAAEVGKANGVVATSAVTHATPAAFVAHELSRYDGEAIAADFADAKGLDLFLGGGVDHFEKRADGRNISDELREKGTSVFYSLDDFAAAPKDTPKGALLAQEHLPKASEREDLLAKMTVVAIEHLSADEDGFFVMVEGSQIDWAGHANDTIWIIEELLDFDKAVGEALSYAATTKDTLVIAISDHETGGFGLNWGTIGGTDVHGGFTSGNHTAQPVPVFAYGPGAENFSGVYENTEFSERLKALIKSE